MIFNPCRPISSMYFITYVIRVASASFAAFGLAACQSSQSSFQGSNFSGETRALEKQLNAEASALGAAQGATSLAASADPTAFPASRRRLSRWRREMRWQEAPTHGWTPSWRATSRRFTNAMA